MSTAPALFEAVDELNALVDEVDKQMRMLVRENEELRRLTTMSGGGRGDRAGGARLRVVGQAGRWESKAPAWLLGERSGRSQGFVKGCRWRA